MKKLRISVIGTGHLGSIHTRLWKNRQNAELAGVYDINPDTAAKTAEENNCRQFADIDSLLKNSDAVTIAVPTSEHYPISLQCIENNVHFFIEKPITATFKEAESLIKKAKKKNLTVQVGHVERFNPALNALKNYKLDPLFIETHRLSQFKPRATDVSVILDLMIHDIDIMLWLVKSKIKKIDANGVAVLTDTFDIANARITFENGVVANLTSSRISAHPMRKTRIFQKDAYISIDFGMQDVEVYRLMDGEFNPAENTVPATMLGTIEAGTRNRKIIFEKPEVVGVNAIAEEQKAFIQAITDHSPVAVSAEEAAEALRIAELISSKLG